MEDLCNLARRELHVAKLVDHKAQRFHTARVVVVFRVVALRSTEDEGADIQAGAGLPLLCRRDIDGHVHDPL